MLTISITAELEESIARIATASGVAPADVARVLLAIPVNGPTMNTKSKTVSSEDFNSIVESLGSRTPPNAPSLDDVDLRSLAYDGIGE